MVLPSWLSDMYPALVWTLLSSHSKLPHMHKCRYNASLVLKVTRVQQSKPWLGYIASTNVTFPSSRSARFTSGPLQCVMWMQPEGTEPIALTSTVSNLHLRGGDWHYFQCEIPLYKLDEVEFSCNRGLIIERYVWCLFNSWKTQEHGGHLDTASWLDDQQSVFCWLFSTVWINEQEGKGCDGVGVELRSYQRLHLEKGERSSKWLDPQSEARMRVKMVDSIRQFIVLTPTSAKAAAPEINTWASQLWALVSGNVLRRVALLFALVLSGLSHFLLHTYVTWWLTKKRLLYRRWQTLAGQACPQFGFLQLLLHKRCLQWWRVGFVTPPVHWSIWTDVVAASVSTSNLVLCLRLMLPWQLKLRLDNNYTDTRPNIRL